MQPIRDYNKRKVENWVAIQTEQLNLQIADMQAEITALEAQETTAKDFLEKWISVRRSRKSERHRSNSSRISTKRYLLYNRRLGTKTNDSRKVWRSNLCFW